MLVRWLPAADAAWPDGDRWDGENLGIDETAAVALAVADTRAAEDFDRHPVIALDDIRPRRPKLGHQKRLVACASVRECRPSENRDRPVASLPFPDALHGRFPVSNCVLEFREGEEAPRDPPSVQVWVGQAEQDMDAIDPRRDE
jgi:hypothetical protein